MILNTMTVVIDLLVVEDKTLLPTRWSCSRASLVGQTLCWEGKDLVLSHSQRVYNNYCTCCMHTKCHSHSLSWRCAYASFNAPCHVQSRIAEEQVHKYININNIMILYFWHLLQDDWAAIPHGSVLILHVLSLSHTLNPSPIIIQWS